MKKYKLVEDYSAMYKKGTKFFVISDSKFIGVKSYVLQSENMLGKIVVTEEDLKNKFVSLTCMMKYISISYKDDFGRDGYLLEPLKK